MFRIALIALFSVCLTESLHAGDEPPAEQRPSAAMLEFLAEFEDVDDETFELLVEHGLRDHEKEPDQDQKHEQDRDQKEAPRGEDG